MIHNVSPAEVRRHIQKWRPAASAELEIFESMNVIRKFFGPEARAIMRDPAIEVIPGKAVCTVKPGDPYKRKFRVVSCGNYAKTTAESQLYAGGAGAESLRALLVHAGRLGRKAYGLDVKSAFLLAPIPSNVTKRYAMRPPRLLVELGLCQEDEVWMIDKALYGFRESPKWWADHRDAFLSQGTWQTATGRVHLEQLASESNVWTIRHENGLCVGHLLVYVDDMLLLTEPGVAQEFIKWLRKAWECTGLKEATASEPLRFLGVDIFAELDEGNNVIGYSLGQEPYVAELLRIHNVRPNAKATAPVPKEWVREVPPEESFSESELRAAQRVTGELLWIAQRTRIDISFCVGLMASWVAKYPTQVSKIGQRVLEYLANTKTHRLSLIPGSRRGLRIYTDASFAPHGSHSISGIVLQYDECCVVWKSKRQSLVTLSTAESELVSGCEGVVLAQSLEALVCELEETLCTKHLLVDNTAAVTLAEGGGSQRTRHLRVRSAFIRDMIDRGELEVSHCPGDIQLADCLTKALMRNRLDDLCNLLGLGPPRLVKSIAKVLAGSPIVVEPLELPEATCAPSLSPFGVTVARAQAGANHEQLRVWLMVTVLLLQAELSDAAQEEDGDYEPLGLELSLLVVLMILSVLFIWESARHCLRSCCIRREDDAVIRVVSADDDDRQARRERRQESVRRAIAREVEDDGLRRRSTPASTIEHPQPTPLSMPYVRVQVETQPLLTAPDLPPPPPPMPPDDPITASTVPSGGLYSDGLRETASAGTSSQLPSTALGIQFSIPGSSVEGRGQARRDASTQTTFERGLEFHQLCDLHMITTSSRTPGALHLFRNCQALRNTTAVQDRMFCRYCLQAFRDG